MDGSKQEPSTLLLKRKHSTLNEGKQDSSFVERAATTRVPSLIAVHSIPSRPQDELSILDGDDTRFPPSLSITKNSKEGNEGKMLSESGKSKERVLNLSKMGCEEAIELPSPLLTGRSLKDEIQQAKLAKKLLTEDGSEREDRSTNKITEMSSVGEEQVPPSAPTGKVPSASSEKVTGTDGNILEKVKI